MKRILSAATALVLIGSGMMLPTADISQSNNNCSVISASAAIYGDYRYKTLSDGTIEIVQYIGNDAKVTIPSEINGKKVTSIARFAFEDNTSIKSVTIPEGVKKIGFGAFRYCANLKTISIPKSAVSISGTAFRCTPWTESKVSKNPLIIINNILVDGSMSKGNVVIPDNVTSIADSAFRVNPNITSVTIPNSVTSIGEDAFRDSSNLKVVKIPKSVKKIGRDAFAPSLWLDQEKKSKEFVIINNLLVAFGTAEGDVVIPDNVTSICDAACYMTNEITSIKIPEGVTNIGEFAFGSYSHMASAYIPKSVKKIGYGAFGYCDGLRHVFFSGTESEWKKIKIGLDNDALENAKVYYNVSANKPSTTVIKKYTSSTNAVRINWGKISGAYGYRIYRYNPRTKKWDTVKNISGGNTTTYRDEKLDSATVYKYKVKAYTKVNGKTVWGEASDSCRTLTKVKKPVINRIKTSYHTQRVFWNEVPGAAGYDLEFSVDGKNWLYMYHSLNSTECVVTELNSGTEYKYRVAAYMIDGKEKIYSGFSDIVSAKTKNH